MNAVTSQELLSIQQDVARAACDKPCVIQRKTTTKDAYGSEAEVWATISPIDLQAGVGEPSAGQLENYAYIIGDLAAFRVKLPVGTDVKLQDHLIIEGLTLVVQVDLTPRSYPSLITCLATVIKQQ
jgi:hypothetical protein